MNIEDQVVSLEIAKKLKDLGFKQDSLFYWIKVKNIEVYGVSYVINICGTNLEFEKIYSAFTASELGELLPLWFDCAKRETQDWTCRFFDKSSNLHHHSFAATMVDAMAKMLIFLIESGLMKV